MDYSKWKVLKSEFFNSRDDSQIKQEYSAVAQWCNENQKFTIEDDGEYFKVVLIPEPTVEEKAQQIRNIRDSYLETFCDPLVTNFLRWNDLTEDEQKSIKDYRKYLLDIPETKGFPNIDVLTYDEWCARK